MERYSTDVENGEGYVGVAVERWQAETGQEEVLEEAGSEGRGRTFAEMREERLANVDPASDAAASATRTRSVA